MRTATSMWRNTASNHGRPASVGTPAASQQRNFGAGGNVLVAKARGDGDPEIQPSTRAQKILVLDDDARIRDLLRRYLGDNGFAVVTADGGPSMNRLWMRERYDLEALWGDAPRVRARKRRAAAA